MISYAQNAEDAVLARLFRNQAEGFYVDIGACHPVHDSVTKHFYDMGWRGLNVEPMRREYEGLCQERPRDINVRAAVSDRTGQVVLYEAPEENRGASTLDPEAAKDHQLKGQNFTPVTVGALTLHSLVERYEIDHIDFLKIDVEGHESVIVRSVDWTTIRPRALVIEATAPGTMQPTHDAWEPVLLAAEYKCTLFDGLNRFYAQADDEEALDLLSVPANVFDEVEPWRWISQLEGAKLHIAQVEEARQIAESTASELQNRLTEPWYRRWFWGSR